MPKLIQCQYSCCCQVKFFQLKICFGTETNIVASVSALTAYCLQSLLSANPMQKDMNTILKYLFHVIILLHKYMYICVCCPYSPGWRSSENITMTVIVGTKLANESKILKERQRTTYWLKHAKLPEELNKLDSLVSNVNRLTALTSIKTSLSDIKLAHQGGML